jgi:hypothetical protein
MMLKVRKTEAKFLYVFVACLPLLLSCGTDVPDFKESNKTVTNKGKSDSAAGLEAPARLSLTTQAGESNGYMPFIEIDYKNSDFAKVIRCTSSFRLLSPAGKLLRMSNGSIQTQNSVESRAAWQSALSSPESCRLIGEKTVRAAFNDMLAASGKYFYIFNPCRESAEKDGGNVQTKCSFDLISSVEVSLQNTPAEKGVKIAQLLWEKESQLTGLALRIREQMLAGLQKQKSCENNESVDAVREARQKALSAALLTGIASSIGGLVGGPQGAAEAAKKTLRWIFENYSSGSEHNPAKCKILADAEAAAKETAAAIDLLSKEIDQLKTELVQLYK